MPTYRSARDLLTSVIAYYRSIQSYSDTGLIQRIDKISTPLCWFETQFTRPQFFRFQFTRPHPYRPLRHIQTKYIAGSDNAKAYLYVQPYRGQNTVLELEESLDMAIAGATGISSGAAHTIGQLLLKEISGFPFTALKRLRFRCTCMCDKVLCYRISGKHPLGHRITLWIGIKDLLVRKVVEHRFKQEELRFNIVVNEHIAPENFKLPASNPE